jgi:hypothetical protein
MHEPFDVARDIGNAADFQRFAGLARHGEFV